MTPILYIQDEPSVHTKLDTMQFKTGPDNRCLVDDYIFDCAIMSEIALKGYRPATLNIVPTMKQGNELLYFIFEVVKGVQTIYHPLSIRREDLVGDDSDAKIMCLSRTLINRTAGFLHNPALGLEFDTSTYAYPTIIQGSFAHPVVMENKDDELVDMLEFVSAWLPGVVGVASGYQLANKDIKVDEFSTDYIQTVNPLEER